ncbi:MAG: acyl carrier protein [Planctomycetaceae bacterium]|nr:acyl carrier protein [Planctomycetaceae bacterium]
MTTQMAETLQQRVIELAAKQVDIPSERVRLDSQFVADLGYDSLDQVEFMMNVEDEFDIIVPDEIAQSVTTVRQAVETIQKRLCS